MRRARIERQRPKLVIIGGMAHSGTTSIARYLGSAPGWRVHASGRSARMLESAELIARDAQKIRALLEDAEREEVSTLVLKAPWIEESYAWCAAEFPSAHYLIALRSFEAIRISWVRDLENQDTLRGRFDTIEDSLAKYQEFLGYALTLARSAVKCALVDHSAFCHSRGEVVRTALSGMGLTGEFDSRVVDPRRALIPEGLLIYYPAKNRQ